MKTGKELLYAIRSTVPNELLNPGLDDYSADVLDNLAERHIRETCQQTGMRYEPSLENFGRVLFFNAMLRGIQIQLFRKRRDDADELAKRGLLNPDGTAKA